MGYACFNLYLEISMMDQERRGGVDISRGSYKEKPTELSWQYAHLHERERERRFFYRREVDRMPINSVRNPLLNPHESTVVLVFTIEGRSTHKYIHAQRHTETEKERSSNNYIEKKKGQMGSI